MILFKNAQWAVTDLGLECIDPGPPHEYLIEAHRLLAMGGIGQGKFYDWPLHLEHSPICRNRIGDSQGGANHD